MVLRTLLNSKLGTDQVAPTKAQGGGLHWKQGRGGVNEGVACRRRDRDAIKTDADGVIMPHCYGRLGSVNL